MASNLIGSGTQNTFGGTSSTPQNAAQAAALAVQNFLKVAPRRYYTVLGTIPAGSSGGATANAVWQREIPIVPAFCTAIDYTIQLPVTLTLAATTGAATVSPFAPYSAFYQQLTIGGAPPWPLTEMTPWYFDDVIHRQNYDRNYPGLGNNASYFATILDQGPVANSFGTDPGTNLTNTSAAATNTNYAFNFGLRQQLQRKKHLLWGSIPFGDPQNRPSNIVQLAPLVGTNPESSLFVAGSGATAVVQSGQTVNVYAKYELAYIDLLPPSITQAPEPLVNFGLQLTPYSLSQNLQAGTIVPDVHRTAQLYTYIHHILVNNQLPIRADYFGLWDDQDQQSARWAYDSQNNTFTSWFDHMHRTYRRYFNTGHYFVDMEGGINPEIPSVTPYDALMSPDESYATQFGIPLTPAMTTALRIPSGTSLTNPYIRTYSFGLVRVPY